VEVKIGETIKRIRLDKGLSLQDVSDRSGVQLATLSRIENNKATGTIEVLEGIALTFGMKLSELISEVEGE